MVAAATAGVMKAARMVLVAVIGSAELATMEKDASGIVGISKSRVYGLGD